MDDAKKIRLPRCRLLLVGTIITFLCLIGSLDVMYNDPDRIEARRMQEYYELVEFAQTYQREIEEVSEMISSLDEIPRVNGKVDYETIIQNCNENVAKSFEVVLSTVYYYPYESKGVKIRYRYKFYKDGTIIEMYYYPSWKRGPLDSPAHNMTKIGEHIYVMKFQRQFL